MGWIRCRCNAYQKQVYVKQWYNPVPQTVRVSWNQLQLEFELQFEAVRTNSQQKDWALWNPGWAPQQNEKEVLLKTEELGVNMLQSVQSPTHLSHTTLSQPFRWFGLVWLVVGIKIPHTGIHQGNSLLKIMSNSYIFNFYAVSKTCINYWQLGYFAGAWL